MSSTPETARFESWLQQRVALDLRSPLYFARVPGDAELFELLEAIEVETFKRKKGNLEEAGQNRDQDMRIEDQGGEEVEEISGSQREAGPVSGMGPFSISEFARLCITMRDDEDAKCSLDRTGQELTRSQLDAGFTRDSYWGVIEERFNNPSLRLHLNMVGNVDGVDSKVPPPCHWSATCVENWSRSGRNEIGIFRSYAGTRAGELTAEGKRNVVLFICTRKRTENEDTRFANLCTRVIPFDSGCDEGGSRGTSGISGRGKGRSINWGEICLSIRGGPIPKQQLRKGERRPLNEKRRRLKKEDRDRKIEDSAVTAAPMVCCVHGKSLQDFKIAGIGPR